MSLLSERGKKNCFRILRILIVKYVGVSVCMSAYLCMSVYLLYMGACLTVCLSVFLYVSMLYPSWYTFLAYLHLQTSCSHSRIVSHMRF